MKTAVSIPDELFEAVDQLARRRRMSRSALYAEALARLVADDRSADVTARLDEVYAAASSDLDPALAATQARSVREAW